MDNGDQLNKAEKTFSCEDFLSDGDFWSLDIAEKLAKSSDIAKHGLTATHWDVIKYVRSYYKDYGKGPAAVTVSKQCGLSMKEICDLFPCGLVRGAYKVAGLPRPAGCI